MTTQAPNRLATARPHLRAPHASATLVLILTTQLMVVLDATVVNIALRDIRDALGFSTSGLSWVVNAYTLTFGGLLLLGARAGDILGRRRVFLAGIAVFTLASLAGGFAQSPGELLAARAVQGVGGALASPSALALLMTMFPSGQERTRAIGLYTAVSVGGGALGLLAGGMLSQWASWRWVLFINVPIGVAMIALGLAIVPDTERVPGRFDLAGAITSTLGMTSLVYGFVHVAGSGWSDAETIGSFALGLVLLAAFVVVELRAEAPIVPLRLFTDRVRVASYLARLLLIAGMFGMFFFLTQLLRDVFGYSDLKTGVAFLPLTLIVFLGSQASARWLVGRFGGYRIMVAGTTLSMLGMLWLTQLGEHSAYLDLLGPLLVFGLGNGLAFVPLTSAALEGVDAQDAGAASGLVNVMQQVGGALGLAVLVTVFGTASKNVDAGGRTGAALERHVFVDAAAQSFWAATLFLVATLALVAVGMRPRSR